MMLAIKQIFRICQTVPSFISPGGEKQRVALAVLIAMHKVTSSYQMSHLLIATLIIEIFCLTAQIHSIKKVKTILISDHNFANYEKIDPKIFAIKNQRIQTTPLPSQEEVVTNFLFLIQSKNQYILLILFHYHFQKKSYFLQLI